MTHWVGNKAPIKITFKNLEGKVLDIIEGEVNQNLFRIVYTPSITNKTGAVTFDVELPIHKKKTTGGLLRLKMPIEFYALRFADINCEKTLTEIMERIPVSCEVKVRGMEIGAKVLISVFLRINFVAQKGALLVEAEVSVKDGKAILYFEPNIKNRIERIQVQQELNKEYGTYLQPEYYFEVTEGGVVAVSGVAKAVQHMTMHFWEEQGVAGSLEGKKINVIYPDGKKEEKIIPKDGNISFEKTLPGKHKVVTEEGIKLKHAILPLEAKSDKDFAIDWKFIAKMEGTRNDIYVPTDSNGKVLGVSGPTIASGFDLGQIDKAGLEKYQFSTSIQSKLMPYVGKP